MAVVQYTGIVNQLRGKLNGSVFNKARGAYTMQRKQQPVQGWRGNQLVNRSQYAFVQRSWAELLPAQQNSWATTAAANPSTDRFGNPTTLSGYNQFIKCNLYRLSIGLSVLAAGASHTTTASSFSVASWAGLAVTSNEFGETIMSGTFNSTNVGGAVGKRTLLDVSIPTSTGVTVYHRNWRRIGFGSFLTGANSIPFEANLGNRYPAVSPNGVLWLRARVVDIATGAVSGDVVTRFVVPAVNPLASMIIDFNGTGNPSSISITYTTPRVGAPPFYQVNLYQYNPSTTPPIVSGSSFRIPEATAAFAVDNTFDTFITLPPGLWSGYRADLIFSQTGAVVSSIFQTFQAP